MELEIRHLKLMHHVARARSLTRAATFLHLTQPALSRQLRGLEDRVGAKLFYRRGRTMQITPAGEKILQAAERVLQLVEQAENEVATIVGGRGGSVRISVECYTMFRWLPPVIEDFRGEFPDVDVDINTEVAPDPLAALREGIIDIAIVASDPPAEEGMGVARLFDDELVLVVAPDHRLARRRVVAAEDFAGEHLILYSTGGSVVVDRVLKPAGVSPRRISAVQVTDGILDLVHAGVGVSVVAKWAAADRIATGTLCAARITRSGLRRRWKVVTPGAGAPPHVAAFAKLVRTNARHFLR